MHSISIIRKLFIDKIKIEFSQTKKYLQKESFFFSKTYARKHNNLSNNLTLKKMLWNN